MGRGSAETSAEVGGRPHRQGAKGGNLCSQLGERWGKGRDLAAIQGKLYRAAGQDAIKWPGCSSYTVCVHM